MEDNTKWHAFSQLKRLYLLDNIATQYGAGKQYSEKLHQIIKKVENQNYRVAVIGEFKRGKSSMINALLGTEILPMDILPTTATVNRVMYGTEKKIQIHYKDGSIQDAEIDQLIEYATKLDSEKEKRAGEIEEICVTYPSVFCKNRIELYDTPGLNDDEVMTETTLSVLKKIDAAIVVIAATKPLSMTERNLIIKLLEHPEIYNIVFVVTFIDQISSKRSEQDKMIEYIRNRISKETMELAKEKHGGNTSFMEKAQRVLENPEVFAVSSILALEGFVKDDDELLDESRFPDFKRSLLEVLTAGQTLDVIDKVNHVVANAPKQLKKWYEGDKQSYEEEKNRMNEALRSCKNYFLNSRIELEKIFLQVDEKLGKAGLDSIHGLNVQEFCDILSKKFISALGSLRVGVTNEDIEKTILQAASECIDYMKNVTYGLKGYIDKELTEGYCEYSKMRQNRLGDCVEQLWQIRLEPISFDEILFPKFCWNGSLYPIGFDFLNGNVIPYIHSTIQESMKVYSEECTNYISSARLKIIMQEARDQNVFEIIQEKYRYSIHQIIMKQQMLSLQYEKDTERLDQLL